jgi:TrpR-related protein YerC/YecD
MTADSSLSRARAELIDDLSDAFARLDDKKAVKAFLADLCTPSELHALAERWHVARLLDEGKLTYREIHEATGVSTTTIVRVARFLKTEAFGGYRTILAKLGSLPDRSS